MQQWLVHILQRQPKSYERWEGFPEIPVVPCCLSFPWWKGKQDLTPHDLSDILSEGSNKMEAQIKLKHWACLAKVGKIQVSRQLSQQSSKQITNPNADGKRDDTQTQGLEQHQILAQENPQHGVLQTCPLSWQQHIFFSSARNLLMCKAKEKPNSCSLLWSPSLRSQPFAAPSYPEWSRWAPPGAAKRCGRTWASPRGTPSSRGARGLQGNTELSGASSHTEASSHITASSHLRASQVFCLPCTELRPTLCLSNMHPCMCITYFYSVYKYTFCPGVKASSTLRHQTAQTRAPTVFFYCARSSELCRIFLTAASPLVELRTHYEARHQAAFTERYNPLHTCWNSIISLPCVIKLLPDFTFAS